MYMSIISIITNLIEQFEHPSINFCIDSLVAKMNQVDHQLGSQINNIIAKINKLISRDRQFTITSFDVEYDKDGKFVITNNRSTEQLILDENTAKFNLI